MKTTVTILFGGEATSAYEEKGKVTKRMLNELGGSLETFTFKTPAELRCFGEGLQAAQGWEDWVETERIEEPARDPRNYYDEHVLLVGDHWETAMAELGHDVTSHLREEGDCPRCDEIDRILEQRCKEWDESFSNAV